MGEQKSVNGVDVVELGHKAAALKTQPDLAKFHFRVQNCWQSGGHSVTSIAAFTGVGAVHKHAHTFKIEAAEPPVLLGNDEGPNPVEILLTALGACLTGAMVYHAAVRGITITELHSTIEGDLDVRGFMGIAPDVRRGYQSIKVSFHVKSDGTKEKLEECARFSPVLDTITNGTQVDIQIENR